MSELCGRQAKREAPLPIEESALSQYRIELNSLAPVVHIAHSDRNTSRLKLSWAVLKRVVESSPVRIGLVWFDSTLYPIWFDSIWLSSWMENEGRLGREGKIDGRIKRTKWKIEQAFLDDGRSLAPTQIGPTVHQLQLQGLAISIFLSYLSIQFTGRRNV